MNNKLLRPDQAAAQLNLSTRSIYRLCSEGDLVCLFVGKGERSLRVEANSISKYIERQLEKYVLGENISKSVTGDDR